QSFGAAGELGADGGVEHGGGKTLIVAADGGCRERNLEFKKEPFSLSLVVGRRPASTLRQAQDRPSSARTGIAPHPSFLPARE
ncbi:MAG: hypothetical protein FWG56_05670, partial [Desulfovibrionaceae bacterium]|nr:hypothetical protein [Desulfovibrionaceae bacterium]